MGTETEKETPGPVLARFERPRLPTRTRIAVLADNHLTRKKQGTWKVLHRTVDRLNVAVSDINARDVSYVQFLGDITSEGKQSEFELFADITERLDAPFGVIPGNHDVPTTDGDEHAPFTWFKAEYASSGFPTVTDVHGVSIIGLNSATLSDPSGSGTWAGEVSETQLSALADILDRSDTPIVFVHHNLGPLPEHPHGDPWSWFQISNAEQVVDVLARHGVSLVFSGHHHVPALASRGTITELLAPATCSFPQSYLLVVIGPDGTTVSLVPLSDRDGMEEAFTLARRDHPIGAGVLSLVEQRIDRLPLTRTEPP